MTSPDQSQSPADFADWLARDSRRADGRVARRTDGIDFADLVSQLASLPPETPEEIARRENEIANAQRKDALARFRRICPAEFMCAIDRTKLTQPEQFDAVAQWDGSFPGPLAFGATDTAKTRAAWSALGRLNVVGGKSFAWFPVKRLLTEFARYESRDLADEFFRYYRGYAVLFVDDIDKINWQFESEGAALFQFFDWIYRERRPCIATTNKPREWWAAKMGDATARRLFADAFRPVEFGRVAKK